MYVRCLVCVVAVYLAGIVWYLHHIEPGIRQPVFAEFYFLSSSSLQRKVIWRLRYPELNLPKCSRVVGSDNQELTAVHQVCGGVEEV